MKNVRMTICLMALVSFMAAGQGLGVVDFNDGGTHNIDYAINDSVSVDSGTPGMHTTVNLLSGGSISLDLAAYEDGRITVAGGTVGKYLAAHENGQVTMSGGSVNSCFYATNNSYATLSGGWVSLLRAQENSHLTISGGVSDRGLDAWNNSTTTFYGKNFQLGSGLTLDGNRLLGTGILSGEWSNGTPWTMRIGRNPSTATILLVSLPEPNLQGISIAGPNSVQEESDTQYHVIGHFDDGSSKNITADANLAVVPDEFAAIDANGVLSTERLFRPREICTINADCEGFSASKRVIIHSVCDGNQCTERQLLKRNIADTIEIKQGITEDLNYAMKIERATMQMMPRVMIRLNPHDRARIVQINIRLLAALTDELWAKRRIDQSVDSLEDAIRLLIVDSNSPPR